MHLERHPLLTRYLFVSAYANLT